MKKEPEIVFYKRENGKVPEREIEKALSYMEDYIRRN